MNELKATSSGEIRIRNALLGYWWYEKSEADKVIAELKTENDSLLQQNRELCQALQVMYSKEEYDKQKAKADKLLSCLKYLVMRDLIKDCSAKKTATEIVKEYDNGLG